MLVVALDHRAVVGGLNGWPGLEATLEGPFRVVWQRVRETWRSVKRFGVFRSGDRPSPAWRTRVQTGA